MIQIPFFKNKKDVKFLCGDYALWVIILFLCLVSLAITYSSTVALAQKQEQTSTRFLLFQLLFLAASAIVMWFISTWMNPNWISKHARALCLLTMSSLVLMATGFGVEKNDATRWISVFGVPVNPFDFLRIAIILDLAHQLTIRRDIIYKIRIVPNFWKWDSNFCKVFMKTTLPMFWPSFLIVSFIFLENISTALIMCIMIFVMLMLGNVRGKQLGNIIFPYGVILLLFCIGLSFCFGGRLDTGFKRLPFLNKFETSVDSTKVELGFKLDSTMNPRKLELYKILKSSDKSNNDYQQTYARIAMASGGFFGKGPGNSTLRSKLPNSYDDFVYAIIVEEYGIFGGVIVLVLYIALLYRGVKIAMRTKYYSLRLISLGLVIHIVLTAFIHMMVATGNFLTTGQALPLISKGGSSILANGVALGIVLCISSRKLKKNGNSENTLESQGVGQENQNGSIDSDESDN